MPFSLASRDRGGSLDNTANASDCTECGQCMEACTQGIEVPEILKRFVRTFE